jgi:hypothetical protein
MIIWSVTFFSGAYVQSILERLREHPVLSVLLFPGYQYMALGLFIFFSLLLFKLEANERTFLFFAIINLIFWVIILILNSLPLLKIFPSEDLFIYMSTLILFDFIFIPPLIKQLYNIGHFKKMKITLSLINAISAIFALLFSLLVPGI